MLSVVNTQNRWNQRRKPVSKVNQMQQSESIATLAPALVAAQAELDHAVKGSQNPHLRNRYADLAAVIDAVRPVFAKHGLGFIQSPSFADGLVSVTTRLFHTSGEWMEGTLSSPVSKQDAQGVGSAITYCRRYSLAAMSGISQADDDGEAAVGLGGSLGKVPKASTSDEPKGPSTPPVGTGDRLAQIASAESTDALRKLTTAWKKELPEAELFPLVGPVTARMDVLAKEEAAKKKGK